jgi:hypothetical protein
MVAQFVPGLDLAARFYADVVRPLLDEAFPDLPHSAALLGPGSEVLGFDTVRSTDHDWGPRLQVFLTADQAEREAGKITQALAARLPARYRGYPTRFTASGDPDGRPVHHCQVAGLGRWLTEQLGFDPRQQVTTLDWLTAPTQQLAEFTGGAVFHDGLGGLGPARANLDWYPHDVWLYILACQWLRIAQEEAFAGRCAEVGDEIGAAVVAARLVRDMMRLCLLMQRRYPPYSKWLGTAFARLPAAPALTPSLTAALSATGWQSRERHLCAALEAIATLHNESGLTEPLPTGVRPYYERPYRVLGASRFAAALRQAVSDPQIRRLPLTGAVDQFVDSTDALGDIAFLRSTMANRLRSAPMAHSATKDP